MLDTPSKIPQENEISKQIKLFTAVAAEDMNRIDAVDKRVLVLPFSDLKKRYSDAGAYIADKLVDELSDIEDVKILNRTDIELIKTELTFQRSGLVSEDDIATIGNFSGANILITGTITDLGNELDVSVTFTAVEKGERIVDSFQIAKTRSTMSLIAAISSEERQKQEEIEQRITQLEDSYEQRKHEIEEDFRKEEEAMEVKLAELEQEIREKSQILSSLRDRKMDLDRIEEEIEQIKQRIVHESDLVKNYIYVGMTVVDVERILGRTLTIVYDPGPVYYCTSVGDYIIVWSDGHRNTAVVEYYKDRLLGIPVKKSARF